MGDETVSFEMHVVDLFTERDQEAMLLQFDLFEVEDVREHAAAILAQLESGRMPCYGAWPAADVDTFRRWVDAGMPD